MEPQSSKWLHGKICEMLLTKMPAGVVEEWNLQLRKITARMFLYRTYNTFRNNWIMSCYACSALKNLDLDSISMSLEIHFFTYYLIIQSFIRFFSTGKAWRSVQRWSQQIGGWLRGFTREWVPVKMPFSDFQIQLHVAGDHSSRCVKSAPTCEIDHNLGTSANIRICRSSTASDNDMVSGADDSQIHATTKRTVVHRGWITWFRG